MLLENLKMLKCPYCDSSELVLEKNKSEIFNGNVKNGDLICKNCGRRFLIRNYVPDLLPSEIREYLENWVKNRPLPRLSDRDKSLAEQIIAMDKMSEAYREVVVDPHTAAEAAVHLEKYEDILLRRELEELIRRSSKDHKGVVFIEVGSGPGRYLVQYGGKVESKEGACKNLRENSTVGDFYSYDPEYDKNLKLIVGIDFSEGMIQSAFQWLRENRLHDLLLKDRIIMIKAAAQYLNLSFEDTPYEDSYKLVTCVFQTLGNQVERSLQIDLLKKMRTWAQPKGLVFVSVFNKAVFHHYLKPYYREIERTIGPISNDQKALEEGVLKTDWGVYSRWFDKRNLKDLFREAEMKKVRIRTGSGLRGLPLFPQESSYLALDIQKLIRERAIIGTVEI